MLENIKSPEDLRGLTREEEDLLCAEMREEILRVVSKNGGHLGSNLGIVEAMLVLHQKFHSPEDKIVFDVGHQCYPHKLLTGRYERFETLRRLGGVSGFPNRAESEHDALNEGHCGTSVSGALGIAAANKLRGSDAWTIAIVGDGALTNGMIYEALNNCADKELNLIILINDNEMSISPNVGGLHDYLSRIRTSRRYFRLKRNTEKVLLHIPLIGKGLAHGFKWCKDLCKWLFVKNNLFEDLGIIYLGPVDGHDRKRLSIVLDEAMEKHRVCIVHMNTLKGKGYEIAEREPDRYHSVSPFDRETGLSASAGESFTSRAGALTVALAEQDERICAITAAMRDGTGLSPFSAAFPERFFDVGIAEEHAVTYASGLAAGGMKPMVFLYSTFAQRSYDQFIHDVAIQRLPMTLMIDRSGLVPGDGVTHQGIFDYPMLSSVPDITIDSPETYEELERAVKCAYASDSFVAVRYPKGKEEVYERSAPMCRREHYEYTENLASADIVIVTYGRVARVAHEAAKLLCGKKTVGIVKLTRIFPLDTDELSALIGNGKPIYVLEEGYRFGGVGEKLAAAIGKGRAVHIHAIERFAEHGELDELYASFGFTPNEVAARLMRALP